MSQNLDAQLDPSRDPDKALLAEFDCLWAEADDLWDRHQDTAAFHAYVSADYMAVYDSLARLRGRVSTFLEWGSGLGVVTIMASCMGFDAYGIEAEAGLVDYSENLAQAYGSRARFVQGSFIPDGFEWNRTEADDTYRSLLDTASAYDQLKMELRDFDLVYAYPWPAEHDLYHNIIRQFGSKQAMLLIYDVRKGIELVRFNDHRDRGPRER